MIFLGDYFSIGLVIVLFVFFFDKNHYHTKPSQIFMACLGLTALTAVTDLISGLLMRAEYVPLWLNVGVNSLYFVINLMTTSAFALYLFTKILEHSYDDHCMTYAKRGLLILFTVYMVFVLANLWNGWLFYFDENGMYCRGPLNAIGYILTVCQMVLVLICYLRNRKLATKGMRRVLIQTFPIIVLCIAVQRVFPDVMLNGYIMAMVATILFLNFQGQRHGIHTLTKLNDRHRFFREVEVRMAQKDPFHTFLISIKNLSTINQKYGHMYGDEFLYQFAFSLERLFKNGVAFHMNGAVFALVVPYTTQSMGQNHRSKLLQFLEDGIECFNEQLSFDYIVTESVLEEADRSPGDFYEGLEYAADLAHQQNLRYFRYTPDTGKQMKREQYLKERIQCVDREHGFRVWYQPIYDLETGCFCSMEALVRLQEPDGSMVSPGEFISLAERTGAIASITWFVLEDVCDFLASHRELGEISVSVNLPMAQLMEGGFKARLDSIVDRYGVQHHRICLEFTEREILDTFEQTKQIMEELTNSGYRFYLDDFGTGYSNFNCMLQLPFQIIKLDASLIRITEPLLEGKGFVQSITELVHDMGMEVIAEGVETREALDRLNRQGVDRIQGYVCAKPMKPEDLVAFFQASPQF
ncbi:MAG: GGDEF domain-containing protein [Ruminiclostridium sp.]|nr:GGDEF domain-containing protein [Ruminiclostridium sp.]